MGHLSAIMLQSLVCVMEIMGLQDKPLHMLQQIVDGAYVGVGQGIALVLDLVGRLASPPALPHSHHEGELSSTTLASSSDSISIRGCHFSGSHALRDSLPSPTLPRSALSWLFSKVQGPLC